MIVYKTFIQVSPLFELVGLYVYLLGLTLSLFIEQDEYMDRIASAAGARVAIHDFHFKPLPDEEGFSVAPGYTTAISLQKVQHKINTMTSSPYAQKSKFTGSFVQAICFFVIDSGRLKR